MNTTIAAIVISAFGAIMAIIWQVQSLAKMIQQDTHKRLDLFQQDTYKRLDDLKKHFDERLDDKFEALRAEFKAEIGPAIVRLGNVEQRLIDVDRRAQRIEEVIFKPVLTR